MSHARHVHCKQTNSYQINNNIALTFFKHLCLHSSFFFLLIFLLRLLVKDYKQPEMMSFSLTNQIGDQSMY